MMVHKITEEFLKEECQEFDVETIYNLSLHNKGLYDLGCIGLCVNIVKLDLSNNNISSVMALRSMSSLQMLDVSNNRLSALSGMEHLETLYMLNVAGNFLNSLDCLLPLTKVENLHTLILEDKENKLTNPVCNNVKFVNNETMEIEVQELLPTLSCLNGSVLTGEGKSFHKLCSEMEDKTASWENLPSFNNVSKSRMNTQIEEPSFIKIGFEKNETYEQTKEISDYCGNLGNEMRATLTALRKEYLA